MKNIDEILENLILYNKNFNIPFIEHSTGDVVLMDSVIDMFDIDIEDPNNVVIITSHDVDGKKKYQDWLWNPKTNAFKMITKFYRFDQKAPKTVWKEKGINMTCPKELTKSTMIDLLKLCSIVQEEKHD